MKCPVCDRGILSQGEVEERIGDVFLGIFPAQICNTCSESFTNQSITKKIEEAAKKKGIWNTVKLI